MSQRTFKHQITVDISAEEKTKILERNADIDRKMIQVKAEKAMANSGFNEDLKLLRKEQDTLLTSINAGKAKIEIEVYEDKDTRLNRMVYRRASDGEQVDERPLTADELNEDKQGDLFAGKGSVETTGEEAPPAAVGDEHTNDPDLEKTLAAFEAEQDAAGETESDAPGEDGDEEEDDEDESDDEDEDDEDESDDEEEDDEDESDDEEEDDEDESDDEDGDADETGEAAPAQ